MALNLINLRFNITAPNTTITLPITTQGTAGVAYSNNWGDGTVNDNNRSHVYVSTGAYYANIAVSAGTVTQFGNGGANGWVGNSSLTDCSSWSNTITSLNCGFWGCSRLVYVPSALPTACTNLFGTFCLY